MENEETRNNSGQNTRKRQKLKVLEAGSKTESHFVLILSFSLTVPKHLDVLGMGLFRLRKSIPD